MSSAVRGVQQPALKRLRVAERALPIIPQAKAHVQQPPSLPSLDECSEDGADSEHEDSWVTTVKRPQMTAAQLSYHLCLQNSDEESDDESAGSDDAGYAGSSDEYDSGSDDDDEEAAGYRLTGRRKMTAEEFAQFLTAGQD